MRTLRIALFEKSTDASYQAIVREESEGTFTDMGYLRVSEYVTVKFPDLPVSAHVQLEALASEEALVKRYADSRLAAIAAARAKLTVPE